MRRDAALLLLLALALLAGCGGGEEETQGTSVEAAVERESSGMGSEPKAEEGGEGQGDGQEQGQGEGPSQMGVPNPPIASERTAGQKAVAPGVPTTKGGDNSIQAFGLEGEETEAGQASAELKAYLEARAREDWAAACEAASAQLKEQLSLLIERATAREGSQKPEGCPETLELFFGKTSPSQLREAARVDRVLSFRVREDGYAYLIYESGGETKFVAMAKDDGTWKANVLEPQAFQQSQGEPQ